MGRREIRFEDLKELNIQTFISINKELIRLKEIAFQIKLKSLNEQILAINNDMQRSGFQVVSGEFILFSKYFEEKANEMQTLISRYLPKISRQLKIKKYEIIKLKALHQTNSPRAKDLLSKSSASQMKSELRQDEVEFLKHLQKNIRITENLALKADVIFLQSKITSAYIEGESTIDALKVLTEDLANLISEIRTSIQNIKRSWGNIN